METGNTGVSTVVFIYLKDGKIKVIGDKYPLNTHEYLLTDGWVHSCTLDVEIFIEQLFNEAPDNELKMRIDSLGLV